MLLDIRKISIEHTNLLHSSDYARYQSVGTTIHRKGHFGLLVLSVRRLAGENVVIFNPEVLSNPKLNCQLAYRLENDLIVLEKQPGVTWITLAVASFS